MSGERSPFGPSGIAGAPLTEVKPGAVRLLDALGDAMVADLESLTDEELRAEFAEDGLDLAVEAARVRDSMLATVRGFMDAQAFVGSLS